MLKHAATPLRWWRNARLATLREGDAIRGAVVAGKGRIVFAGRDDDLPSPPASVEPVGGGGRLVTPALLDRHTHLVFGGHRAREFETRLAGASYEQIALAGTVAVLLPGAFYTLRERQPPPVAAMRAAGVRMAVATDCNPGKSPLTSLLLAMNMTATLFGLTVNGCLAGTTREAARARGLLSETGTLEPGKSADPAIWDAEHPAELVCRRGFNPLRQRIYKGTGGER